LLADGAELGTARDACALVAALFALATLRDPQPEPARIDLPDLLACITTIPKLGFTETGSALMIIATVSVVEAVTSTEMPEFSLDTAPALGAVLTILWVTALTPWGFWYTCTVDASLIGMASLSRGEIPATVLL
jgi:hypothetical protein